MGPNKHDPRHAQAKRLLQADKTDDAAVIYEALLRENHLDFEALFHMGIVAWRRSDRDAAISFWRRCLSIQPEHVASMMNLGNALHDHGQFQDALRYAQMASRRRPGDADCLLNLSIILKDLGEAPAAMAAVTDGLASTPGHPGLLFQRMVLCAELKDWPRLRQSADAILTMRPADPVALGHRWRADAENSHWQDLHSSQARLVDEITAHPSEKCNPLLMSQILDAPEELRLLASHAVTPYVHPHGRQVPTGDRGADGRLRIAFLSPDLRSHPVGHMLHPVLAGFRKDSFDVTLLRTIPDPRDPVSTAIASLSDRSLDLSGMDDRSAVAAVRNLELDAVIDLAGFTQWHRHRLLQRGLARRQFLWLGYPLSTGAACYDGFIVDGKTAPDGYDRFCSEPLLRLPDCYHPICLGLDPPPRELLRRTDLDIPEESFVFGLFQTPRKIAWPFIDRLAEILNRNPTAYLVCNAGSEAAVGNIVSYLAERAIDRSRIRCLGFLKDRQQHFAKYGLADLILDPFPYGGHSTVGEALCLGVPVLCLQGTSIHARVGASMLDTLGLHSLIAPSPDRYTAIASSAASDRNVREEIAAATRAAALRIPAVNDALSQALQHLLIEQCRRPAVRPGGQP